MSKSHSKKNLSVPTFSLSWCIWVHLGDSILFNFVQLVALLNFTCILRMTCSTCKTIGIAQGTLIFLAEIRNKLFEQPSYASSLRFFGLPFSASLDRTCPQSTFSMPASTLAKEEVLNKLLSKRFGAGF